MGRQVGCSVDLGKAVEADSGGHKVGQVLRRCRSQPALQAEYLAVFRHHKIVYFFLIEHQGGDIRDHDFEVDEVRWFPLAEAERVASYESEREILRKAGELIAKRLGNEATRQ
jgi:hypothetical protein